MVCLKMENGEFVFVQKFLTKELGI